MLMLEIWLGSKSNMESGKTSHTILLNDNPLVRLEVHGALTAAACINVTSLV